MSKLKIGVVGTGKVAQANYLPYLAKRADVELAYYNRTREKAVTCADKFGGMVCDTYAALGEWKPDAVLVLTREMDRYEAAVALLELPVRRIFFEKPLVARHGQENVTEQDFEDARAILRQAAALHVETAMVFNYRFFTQSQRAKKLAAERDFGKVMNFTGLVHYACWSHCIDLAHYFAGPVTEVSALASREKHDMGSMSANDVCVAFRTEGDATGTLIGTTTLAWEHPLFELSINFERGRIRMQDLDGEMDVMDARSMTAERYRIAGARSRWDQYNASFTASVEAYLDSVRAGNPPPVPGIAGLMELQFEAGIKRSIAESRPVILSAEFPLT